MVKIKHIIIINSLKQKNKTKGKTKPTPGTCHTDSTVEE